MEKDQGRSARALAECQLQPLLQQLQQAEVGADPLLRMCVGGYHYRDVPDGLDRET